MFHDRCGVRIGSFGRSEVKDQSKLFVPDSEGWSRRLLNEGCHAKWVDVKKGVTEGDLVEVLARR